MATTIVNKNIPLIHRKEPQFMSMAPFNTSAGAFVVGDVLEEDNLALYVASATAHYLYHHDEDGWVQIPSGGLGGTFGAGTCGARSRWSTTITANGGSTTTATTTTAISGLCRGSIVRFLTGANAGLESTIINVTIIPGGTNTIQFSTLPNTVASSDTFIINTGRYYVWNAGTMSATSFRVYDPLLGTWTSLSVTGAPASWGTDGKLLTTPSNVAQATGTATAGATATLTNSTKSWTTNQWTNYQIRITAGTGIGQVRTIASNTGTVITVTANWVTTPDTTSQYVLEGNDDFIYLLGGGAVTMFRYSISGNTWTTISPIAARAAAPSTGMSANWISDSEDVTWRLESNIQNGRYIYSFQGGATGNLHRYDIAANTWVTINSTPITIETFTTGTSYSLMGRYIYIRQNTTLRMFKFSTTGNYLEPLTTTMYPEGTAIVGDRMWGKKYIENGSTKLVWLYWLQNTGNILHRMLII